MFWAGSGQVLAKNICFGAQEVFTDQITWNPFKHNKQ
jgi:hypothetical protein